MSQFGRLTVTSLGLRLAPASYVITLPKEEDGRQFVITSCEKEGLNTVATVLISMPGRRLSCRIGLKGNKE